MMIDEKVVKRLLELKEEQKKAWGGRRNDPAILEFDKIIVEEIERGVNPLELAYLLGYTSSQAITNRYKRIKKYYSIGFTQTGEVRSIGRGTKIKAETVDIDKLKTTIELEIISKQFFDLEEKIGHLVEVALENKIPYQDISNTMNIPIVKVKYFVEKKREGEKEKNAYMSDYVSRG